MNEKEIEELTALFKKVYKNLDKRNTSDDGTDRYFDYYGCVTKFIRAVRKELKNKLKENITNNKIKGLKYNEIRDKLIDLRYDNALNDVIILLKHNGIDNNHCKKYIENQFSEPIIENDILYGSSSADFIINQLKIMLNNSLNGVKNEQ